MAELFAKYNCTNCQEDIQGICVHCAECVDFELCLQCFAAGAEIGAHKTDHAYQFMDSGILSIFRGKSGWSAREELHLLDAIEQYGFGNWEDISKHIETRSPEDAKEEYVNKFLNGTIGRHTWLPATTQRPHLIDHTENDTGPLSQLLTQRLPPIDVSPEEASQLGYMPNRDDFEREYDPGAEALVSTLSLNPDDDDVDVVLKLAQMDIYTRRLRERVRRKRQVRDYQLVSNFFRGSRQRVRLGREQREFRDRFRLFAQFYTAHEFDRLLSSMDREKALRIRLAELHRYRFNGLTRIDECVHFEQHTAAGNRNTGPHGAGRTDNNRVQPGDRVSSLGQTNGRGLKGESAVQRSTSFTDKRYTPHIADQAYCDASLPSRSSSDSIQGTGLQNLLQDPLRQPGGNLLTTNEIQLCNTLNLPPTKYITLKTILLSGAILSSSTASTIEMHVKKFLIKSGLLQMSPLN